MSEQDWEEDDGHESDGDYEDDEDIDIEDEECHDDFEEPAKKKSKPVKEGKAASKAKKTKGNTKKGSKSSTVSASPPTSAPAKKSSKSAGKKKSKQAQATGTTAEAMVLKYMTEQNRPFSALQVFDNLHKTIKKPHVVRILDQLVKDGKVTLKEFGRSKLFHVDQSLFPTVDQAELARLDKQILELTETHKHQSAAAQQWETGLQQLLAEPTDAELDQQLALATTEFDAKSAKLATLRAGAAAMSKEDIDKMQEKFNAYFLAWKKRKRATKDALDTVMENAPKSKKLKHLMEEIGVETDEEFSLDFPAYQGLYRKIDKPRQVFRRR